MSLYLNKETARIMLGNAHIDKKTGKILFDGPAEDVTEKFLALFFNYIAAVSEYREKKGLSDTFELSSPENPCVVKVVNTKNKADYGILLDENSYEIKNFMNIYNSDFSNGTESQKKYKKEKDEMNENTKQNKSENVIRNTKEDKKQINTEENVAQMSEKKRKRRTKAEMEAARKESENILKEVKTESNPLLEKPKRKRRTKAEMEAARAKAV